jgi:hypothetical protein
MMPALPHWLRSVDNGKIGEARTRAILINRFWILERSVDIEGADLIIQRKIWGQNLLDQRAPCLGYVQSKYAISEATRINIRRDYILDSDGLARKEFFLFVHFGEIGSEISYFVDANTIKENFHKGSEAFSISVTDLAKMPDARIRSTEHILSLIEHALTAADFRKNRLFYGHLALNDSSPEAILDYDFTLPLGNAWGDLIEHVQEIRDRTNTLIHDLGRDIETLKKALSFSNPIDFLETFEFERFNALEDYFYHNNKFFEGEFYNVLVNHRKRVDLLRSHDLLQQFLIVKSLVLRELENRFGKYLNVDAEYVCLELRIRMSDLEVLEIKDFSAKEQEVVPSKPRAAQKYGGATISGDTVRIYVQKYNLFAANDSIRRWMTSLCDDFDEAILVSLFGEDELYN